MRGGAKEREKEREENREEEEDPTGKITNPLQASKCPYSFADINRGRVGGEAKVNLFLRVGARCLRLAAQLQVSPFQHYRSHVQAE